MKPLFIFLCFFISLNSYAQVIEIEDNNFEQTLVDLKIDSDQMVNGQLLKSDAQTVVFLDLSNKKITNLKGIEAFTSLQYFYCQDNPLTNIDLSQNTALIFSFTGVNDMTPPNSGIFDLSWFD
jgi:Leucine-rich repeat (LRR) protein